MGRKVREAGPMTSRVNVSFDENGEVIGYDLVPFIERLGLDDLNEIEAREAVIHHDDRDLLSDVGDFVCRFVVLSKSQRVAIALWIAHTHAFDAAEATPYLALTSASKRSGKTRLLE